MRDFYTTIDEQMNVFRDDVSYRASGQIRLHMQKTKFNNKKQQWKKKEQEKK